jgi:hypothetical protein
MAVRLVLFLALSLLTHEGFLILRNDPIPRSEFVAHIFNPIYKSSSADVIAPDNLAVLFILLALGSILDLRQPFDHSSAEPLFQLSCAAFCLEPIYETASIPSIQALVSRFLTDNTRLSNSQVVDPTASHCGLSIHDQ